MSLFGKTKDELQEEVKELTTKLEKAETKISLLEANEETNTKEIKDLKSEIEQAKKKADLDETLQEQQKEIAVNQATKTLKKERDDALMENNTLKKEVEILTKAFENMGFDVKDMKDILNKLRDIRKRERDVEHKMWNTRSGL